MSAWLPWIIAAIVLIVLPVALRSAGDEPDNAITQEQSGDDDGERDPEPGVLPLAA
jgi:hypothetical protein